MYGEKGIKSQYDHSLTYLSLSINSKNIENSRKTANQVPIAALTVCTALPVRASV